MTKPNQFQLLFIIMATTMMIVTCVSLAILYDVAIAQHRSRLVDTVKSQARLIEAIARFDQQNDQNENNLEIWQQATLKKVIDAHSQFEGFGSTGEFTMARRSGDQIVFELSHRHFDLDKPKPIPYAGNWAEAMRKALSNQSGTLIGPDYRGVQVLAAFEPVKYLNFGLVAKLDMEEIREPFVYAAVVAMVAAIFLILIASQIYIYVTRPIVENIERQAEIFQTLANTIKEGVFLIDVKGIIQFVNPAAQALFGYSEAELKGFNVSKLMPSPHRDAHDSYLEHYIQTGQAKIIGTGRQLTGLRKDGSIFPLYLSVGDINLRHTRLFTGVVMDISEQQQLQREVMEIPIREQRRIGQDLHDGLGQQLTGLSMLATSLLNKSTRTEYDLAKQLAQGLKESISAVRALARGLTPVEINAEGFNNSLSILTNEVKRQNNVAVSFETDNLISLSDDAMALNLYRIAQEALNNAIKHSKGGVISVTLEKQQNSGCLKIIDNGCGISDATTSSTGLGLRIMKYRSGLFNGELNVSRLDQGGTMVACRFPLATLSETL